MYLMVIKGVGVETWEWGSKEYYYWKQLVDTIIQIFFEEYEACVQL